MKENNRLLQNTTLKHYLNPPFTPATKLKRTVLNPRQAATFEPASPGSRLPGQRKAIGMELSSTTPDILKNMHQQRQVLLYPGEDGFWVFECPSLPGCVSQRRTKQEPMNNIKEAMALYIESLASDGLPVPEDQVRAEVLAI